MPLSRTQLIDRSEGYFEACNAHNQQAVMDSFGADCLMWFPAATFVYRGKEALDVHFKDFLGTFSTINFHDYTHVVDVESQRICTYFMIFLTKPDGEEIRMKNCNIFHVDQNGQFEEIIIYNSGALSDGFHAGSE